MALSGIHFAYLDISLACVSQHSSTQQSLQYLTCNCLAPGELSLLLTPTHRRLIVLFAGQDGNLCVYDVAHSYLPIKYLSTSSGDLPACIAVSSDSSLLATVSRSDASPLVSLLHPWS